MKPLSMPRCKRLCISRREDKCLNLAKCIFMSSQRSVGNGFVINLIKAHTSESKSLLGLFILHDYMNKENLIY